MSFVDYYYDYDKNTEFFYPLNISLINHFANLLYDGDVTRMVYATNDYSFRARSDKNKKDSTLDLPYMSFKRTNISLATDWNRWSTQSVIDGIYVPELGEKVRLIPIQIDFEGLIITASEKDNFMSFKRIMLDNAARTVFSYDYLINNCEINNHIEIFYDDPDYDPTWNENDWLVQNKMHSVGLNFNIRTFMTDIDRADGRGGNYSLTEKVIFDFTVNNMNGNATYEERLEFIVNQFDETVLQS